MRIDILTLFPEMFQGPLNESLLKKALTKGLFSFNLINIRDFATDKHKTVDDSPYGGGPGMVMRVDVVTRALCHACESESVVSIRLRLLNDRRPAAHRVAAKRRIEMSGNDKTRIILLCPTGKPLTQAKINQLAKEEHLVLVCGHYDGIDDRIREYVDEEISIGDYVLTGGELPAMVLIDAVVRQIPGVVKEAESVQNDSFANGLLDYPSYTRPEEFEGKKVPEVLLSGNHAEIDKWRQAEALRITKERRPDLLHG